MKKHTEKDAYLHKDYPKTRSENDFWGQVCRTVNGVPVPQEQIDMIVRAVKTALVFVPDDILLDLGCGNGALSRYFFDQCMAFEGVDFSPYLIQIAKKYFERKPAYVFTEMDALEYVKAGNAADRYTKALCYGAFSYLKSDDAEGLLSSVASGYPNINRFFIGNLPDKARSHVFYKERNAIEADLDDNESPIGIWRTKEEIALLAARTGWKAIISVMPKEFYAAHYRYDVLLLRNT